MALPRRQQVKPHQGAREEEHEARAGPRELTEIDPQTEAEKHRKGRHDLHRPVKTIDLSLQQLRDY